MNLLTAILLVAFICIVRADDKPEKGDKMDKSPEQMAKMVSEFANGFKDSADKFKEEIRAKIAADPNTYTLEETNKFLDAVCQAWKASFMQCSDFKTFVIDEKKKAGKIKS